MNIISDILFGKVPAKVTTLHLQMEHYGRISQLGSDAIFIVQSGGFDYLIPIDSILEIVFLDNSGIKLRIDLPSLRDYAKNKPKILPEYEKLNHQIVKNADGGIDHISIDED